MGKSFTKIKNSKGPNTEPCEIKQEVKNHRWLDLLFVGDFGKLLLSSE